LSLGTTTDSLKRTFLEFCIVTSNFDSGCKVLPAVSQVLERRKCNTDTA